jgi:hypothetical protein
VDVTSLSQGHGKWLPWLREFECAEVAAWRFMQVPELSKSSSVKDLNVDVTSLYRLAAPSTPAETIDAVAESSERGEKFTLEQVSAPNRHPEGRH